ncbi:Zn-ribbon domain-containing OB-fold protein [Pseudomonas sp. B392_1p]|uniref:Zn-ribbon domain-containing OB-fold protein n=1 Tax=Pseudomonas sp. B392_1p TaxID=3457507 RepID=UPI003FD421FF
MQSLLPESDYQRFLAEGRFMLQRSRQTGAYVFYPRVAGPGTGSTDLEWVEASGRGVVYSTTVVRQRPPTPNYNVALIDLEEGVRMMSRVEGIAPEEVRIGMAVRAKVAGDDPAAAVLVFEPA